MCNKNNSSKNQKSVDKQLSSEKIFTQDLQKAANKSITKICKTYQKNENQALQSSLAEPHNQDFQATSKECEDQYLQTASDESGTQNLLNTSSEGLTSEEVIRRRDAGYGNAESQSPMKSTLQIVLEHVVTPFNILNLILASIVFFVAIKQPKYFLNILFLGVATINTISGIIQEIKARKEVQRLSLLSQPRV